MPLSHPVQTEKRNEVFDLHRYSDWRHLRHLDRQMDWHPHHWRWAVCVVFRRLHLFLREGPSKRAGFQVNPVCSSSTSRDLSPKLCYIVKQITEWGHSHDCDGRS